MPENQLLKLHLGCGTNKLSGWVNIDAVKDCQPDLVCDLSRPLPYADQSVDEILAEDLLEHFDKYMRYLVFLNWTRILKIGGKITIQVPNFKKILYRYFKFGFDHFVDFIFGENMLNSQVYLGHFGNHKWGYSKKSLGDFVGQFGIVPNAIEEKCLNLRLMGIKRRHISQEEMDDIRIYSIANDKGRGEATLPLRFIREKVEIFLERNRG